MNEHDAHASEAPQFEVLDQYVAALHAGQEDIRAQLLRRYPELANLLDCLDSLERLAPEGSLPPADAPPEGPFEHGAAPGGTFGKYVLLGEVGRGGMGVVFQARQTDLNRTVALKMILSSHLASAEDVRRFGAEAQAAGGLQHPNIVGIHEFGEVHGQHYFTMDYVRGPSLAEMLSQGSLDPQQAARLLATVALAVDYLHQHNIVHRDLKPSNIVLNERGEPHITDFGLAKVFTPDRLQTPTGAVLGTPSYMSPEQASGRQRDVTPKCDIYSLGAILFEMLTGRPPYKEETFLETLVQVIEGEPPLPRLLNRDVPRDLERACLRALERNPADRYASAADLADDLERFLRGEPVAAASSGVLERLRRWARREPALSSHLAALGAASLIVQWNYLVRGVDRRLHLTVMCIFALWAACSIGFQYLSNRALAPVFTRYAWSALDVVLLTVLLLLAEQPIGTLLIGYPVLIAASGMFFQVRLVAFTTIVSMVSYGLLARLRSDAGAPPHYPLLFEAVLAIFGFMVAYQIHRVRLLTRYYERPEDGR